MNVSFFRCRRASALLFATSLLVLSSRVSAQSVLASGDPEAAAVTARGAEAYRAHRFEEARLLFEDAVRREPSPQRWYNLATACRPLSRYSRAIEAYEHYLAAPPPNTDPAQLSGVRGEISSMRALLGHLTLNLRPDAALASLDGQPLVMPVVARALDPGAHTLEFSAEGYRPERREIRVESGATLSLDVVLTAAPVENPHLVVEPSVASATVLIDGQPAGSGRVDRTLPAGPHVVDIQASGYETLHRTVTLPAHGTLRVDATLTRRGLPGWVVPTVVAGSVVVVAGTVLGIWLATRDTAPELHPAWGTVTE